MLWFVVLLWTGIGLAQESASGEQPERTAEEHAQWEEVERLREACEEAHDKGS